MNDGQHDAAEVLNLLQAAVDSRDVSRLASLFDESAILVGTSGEGRDPESLLQYLTDVASQEERLRWEWAQVVTLLEQPGLIGIAAFGDVVLAGEGGEWRSPIRATVLANNAGDGWRIRHFHGSIPYRAE